jgi:hypothetical protein
VAGRDGSAGAAGQAVPHHHRGVPHRFDRLVRDGIGALRVRDLSVSRLDRLVMQVHDRFGVAAAKTTLTVLSGMVGLAVRYDALERNPVRDVGRVESRKSSARALSVDEATDLRAKLHVDPQAHRWNLVDLTDFMLATGRASARPVRCAGTISTSTRGPSRSAAPSCGSPVSGCGSSPPRAPAACGPWSYPPGL